MATKAASVPAEELITVDVSVEGRVNWRGTATMTRDQYDEWCDTIDSARGYEAEEVTEEVLQLAGIDLMRDMDIDDLRVADFCEMKPRKPAKAGAL